MKVFFASFSAVIIAALPVGAFALDIPPNDGYVTDAAGILGDANERDIEADLQSYANETTNEIAVVILQSLNGEAPSDAAVEIGRTWGVGTDDDNGILLLVSYEDRDIWIATGYGLEGAVPDVVAYGVANKIIAPKFRDGAYAEGIREGIAALKKHIGGEYAQDRYENESQGASAWIWLLFAGFIVFEYAAAWLAKSKSFWAGGVLGGILGIVLAVGFSWWLSIPVLVVLGLLFDYMVSKDGPSRVRRGRHWRRGGGGPFSGSGGGGFGGFGGGSFGGGGGGSKW